jgi:hypothetical protein
MAVLALYVAKSTRAYQGVDTPLLGRRVSRGCVSHRGRPVRADATPKRFADRRWTVLNSLLRCKGPLEALLDCKEPVGDRSRREAGAPELVSVYWSVMVDAVTWLGRMHSSPPQSASSSSSSSAAASNRTAGPGCRGEESKVREFRRTETRWLRRKGYERAGGRKQHQAASRGSDCAVLCEGERRAGESRGSHH